MLELTSQERLALVVIVALIAAGAVGRHAANREAARQWLEYTADAADTLNSSSNRALRERVEEEVTLESIRRRSLGPGEKIDPNTAPPEQLDRLPRVGAALAQRIVAHRESIGPFGAPDDLLAVAGIGRALLDGIAPYLEIRNPPPRSPPEIVGAGARGSGGDRIDINRATAEELQRLPGVGPVLAERIVAERQANGRFRSVGDLERVSGIGPALRARLEGAVRLGNR